MLWGFAEPVRTGTARPSVNRLGSRTAQPQCEFFIRLRAVNTIRLSGVDNRGAMASIPALGIDVGGNPLEATGTRNSGYRPLLRYVHE